MAISEKSTTRFMTRGVEWTKRRRGAGHESRLREPKYEISAQDASVPRRIHIVKRLHPARLSEIGPKDLLDRVLSERISDPHLLAEPLPPAPHLLHVLGAGAAEVVAAGGVGDEEEVVVLFIVQDGVDTGI